VPTQASWGLEDTQGPAAPGLHLRRAPPYLPLYVGLAKSGIIRSPFFPRAEGDLALAKSDRAKLRVLFVGNSFTYYNDMPAMVHGLAEEDPGGRPLFTVEYTAPNRSLHEASDSEGLADLTSEIRWDVVVLQDASYNLSYSREWWGSETLPYAASPCVATSSVPAAKRCCS
jgi:hypothetical protein